MTRTATLLAALAFLGCSDSTGPTGPPDATGDYSGTWEYTVSGGGETLRSTCPGGLTISGPPDALTGTWRQTETEDCEPDQGTLSGSIDDEGIAALKLVASDGRTPLEERLEATGCDVRSLPEFYRGRLEGDALSVGRLITVVCPLTVRLRVRFVGGR